MSVRPFRDIKRRKTKVINVGNVKIDRSFIWIKNQTIWFLVYWIKSKSRIINDKFGLEVEFIISPQLFIKG